MFPYPQEDIENIFDSARFRKGFQRFLDNIVALGPAVTHHYFRFVFQSFPGPNLLSQEQPLSDPLAT